MADFPLPLTQLFGSWGAYSIYLMIGLGFGFVLESAGFGNSTKLAAQFYGRDLTVFKVMFTAIIVAMSLIFLTSAVGLLDYNLVWVPPTYLWPGIIGGLIMGVGFIIGGFCPGTSLVAMTTGKLDGVFFVFGVLTGIFLFGETVQYFDVFFNSSYMGRFTLPELFNVSTGSVVLTIVVMAVMLFWGAEHLETWVNKQLGTPPSSTQQPSVKSANRSLALPGVAAMIALALSVYVIGQPTTEDRWQKLAPELQAQIDNRAIYVSPKEILSTQFDHSLQLVIYDVRSEVQFNHFHLADAKHLKYGQIAEEAKALRLVPANTVILLVDNDEQRATETWKQLKAESVQNVYVLEGGVKRWLNTFTAQHDVHYEQPASPLQPLLYQFDSAVGAQHPAAKPSPVNFPFEGTPKIKLELKRAPASGGCA
ncbi:YeeE/YedE thiosulfate transporter family protein [Vibrio mediterranei]|uniref:YeeE/YedE thiosulfate transporter family protein n=1 Tax=Vibrio mediterranei TaxID=689 RepID=UPI0040699020